MALLFCDSFDHYLTADINEKWVTASNASISAGNGRRSTAGGWISSTQYFGCSLANQATIICGAAYAVAGVPTSIARILSLWDSATQQVGLYLNQDLTLEVLRGGSTSVTNGKSTLTLAVNRWYFIEWKVTIADSIGASSCVVKVDGQTWITVATGQDVKNTSNAYATEIRLGGSSASPVSYWDDFYLCDSSGSTNNDFLGDIRVDVLAPNGEGSNSGWTCSTGSTHYALVDETTPNDDTDYLSTSSAAARDSHNMASLPSMTSPTIKAV